MKKSLIFCISLLLLMALQIPTAFACSYGYVAPTPISEFIKKEVVVRGTVIQNSGGNSIVQVEHYLKGNGPEYLLVYRQSPGSYQRKVVRGYDHGCGVSLPAIAPEGTRAYFSLGHRQDGTYWAGFWNDEFIINLQRNESEQFVEYLVYHGDFEDLDNHDEDNYERFRVSEAEFESTIADLVGQHSSLPNVDAEYPRFRSLYLTTERGQRYILPVDDNELSRLEGESIPCEVDCSILSPDGSHFAHRLHEEGTYVIWYQQGYPDKIELEATEPYKPPRIAATDILFSPNGDYLIAWNDNILTIYGLNLFPEYGYYGLLPTLVPIWETTLTTNDLMTADIIAGYGAWSSNSNVIAYWDADGLKWLDLMTMIGPRLLIEHNLDSPMTVSNRIKLPTLLELSSSGRYIRFGTSQEWSLIDTVSGWIFDDTIVTPDETELVQISPEKSAIMMLNDVFADSKVSCAYYDQDNQCIKFSTEIPCKVPIASCTKYIPIPDEHELIELHWQTNRNLILMTCAIDNNKACLVYNHLLDSRYYQSYSFDDISSYDTNGFVYDEYYGYVAWATDDYTLRLSLSRYEDGIDFSEVLDSPIVSLEWGEPLWYKRH